MINGGLLGVCYKMGFEKMHPAHYLTLSHVVKKHRDIITPQTIIGKNRTFNITICVALLDYEIAFDSVARREPVRSIW